MENVTQFGENSVLEIVPFILSFPPFLCLISIKDLILASASNNIITSSNEDAAGPY